MSRTWLGSAVAEKSSLWVSTAGLTSMRVGNAGLGIIATALLARRLGPQLYGLFASLLALDALSNVVGEWATTPYLVGAIGKSDLEADHSASPGTVASLRLVTGSLSTIVVVAVFLSSVHPYGVDRLLLGALICVPSLGYFTTTAGAALLGRGHRLAFAINSQIPGVLWSMAAIALSLANQSIEVIATGFASVGIVVCALNVLMARHFGLLRWVTPRFDAIGDAVGLWRMFRRSAVRQFFTVLPWRILPATVFWTQSPRLAGEIIVGLKYWEQASLPVTSLTQMSLRETTERSATDSSAISKEVLWVSLVVALGFVGLSFPYVRVVLGSHYSGLQGNLAGGFGLGVVASVLLGLPQLMLAAKSHSGLRSLSRTALVGICAVALSLCLVGSSSSPNVVLALISLVFAGVLVAPMLLSTARRRIEFLPAVLLAAGCVSVVFAEALTH